MADLHITGELAERIRQAAKQEQLDIEAYLDSLLSPQEEKKTTAVTLGLLASALRGANIHTGYTDTAQRFEDIMDEEFTNDLLSDQSDLGKDDQSAG